jgi:hypothetical protein
VQRIRPVGVERLSREQVRERVQALRRYRWSSYRAYTGSAPVPSWLTTSAVLALGGKGKDPRDRYREYCEAAIREGRRASPWEEVVGQAVLGTERFVARVAAGLGAREAGRRWGKRPTLDQAIAAVERVRGERWAEFRDRHGDAGRDLVLYLGRKGCGLGYRALSEQAQIQYVSAATAVRRFAARLTKDRGLAGLLERATKEMHNE